MADPSTGFTEISAWGKTVWPPTSTDAKKTINVTNLGPPKSKFSVVKTPGSSSSKTDSESTCGLI